MVLSQESVSSCASQEKYDLYIYHSAYVSAGHQIQSRVYNNRHFHQPRAQWTVIMNKVICPRWLKSLQIIHRFTSWWDGHLRYRNGEKWTRVSLTYKQGLFLKLFVNVIRCSVSRRRMSRASLALQTDERHGKRLSPIMFDCLVDPRFVLKARLSWYRNNSYLSCFSAPAQVCVWCKRLYRAHTHTHTHTHTLPLVWKLMMESGYVSPKRTRGKVARTVSEMTSSTDTWLVWLFDNQWRKAPEGPPHQREWNVNVHLHVERLLTCPQLPRTILTTLMLKKVQLFQLHICTIII